MQRKFLEDLGLDKDNIDKVLNQYNQDLEKAKQPLVVERDSLKDQLKTAQDALKEFDGVDVKDLQGKIDSLNTELANKNKEYKNKIADMEFTSVLDSALSKSGAKNSKAVKALLDLDNLKKSKNQAEDIEEAIKNVKSDNDYMFKSDEPIKNPVKNTGNTNIKPDSMSAIRSAMGLGEPKEDK